MRRLLILLYPAAWRARYGAELEALMADAPERNFDVLKGAFAMRLRYLPVWVILPVLVVVGAVSGWVASYGVTEEWESRAVMQITPAAGHEGVPAEALNEEILKLRNAVTSRLSLSSLIQDPKLNLYETERRSRPLEDVEAAMRADIRVAIQAPPAGKSGRVFVIVFRYPDPKKAQDTVNALITRFIDGDATTQRASFQLRLLDAPGLPSKPMYPGRAAFSFAGGGAGLVLSFLMLLIRRRVRPGLQPA